MLTESRQNLIITIMVYVEPCHHSLNKLTSQPFKQGGSQNRNSSLLVGLPNIFGFKQERLGWFKYGPIIT